MRVSLFCHTNFEATQITEIKFVLSYKYWENFSEQIIYLNLKVFLKFSLIEKFHKALYT